MIERERRHVSGPRRLVALGRLRVTVKAQPTARGAAFHVDTIDLYSLAQPHPSLRDARRRPQAPSWTQIESDLLAVLVEAEKAHGHGRRGETRGGLRA